MSRKSNYSDILKNTVGDEIDEKIETAELTGSEITASKEGEIDAEGADYINLVENFKNSTDTASKAEEEAIGEETTSNEDMSNENVEDYSAGIEVSDARIDYVLSSNPSDVSLKSGVLLGEKLNTDLVDIPVPIDERHLSEVKVLDLEINSTINEELCEDFDTISIDFEDVNVSRFVESVDGFKIFDCQDRRILLSRGGFLHQHKRDFVAEITDSLKSGKAIHIPLVEEYVNRGNIRLRCIVSYGDIEVLIKMFSKYNAVLRKELDNKGETINYILSVGV